MRRSVIQAIIDAADRDSRVLLLTGDLGFSVVEPFAERFPDRFFNVGVAEQNMLGVATGLAESGYIPFVYSIATFASTRPYEFVRNGPILHGLPVRILGVGGGFEYGHAGPSHHAIEDVGIMRIQPGITVIAPADHRQASQAIHTTWHMDGPIYYRIGKDDSTALDGLDGAFELGRAQLIRRGRDVTLVAMGPAAFAALEAAEALEADGVDAAVAIVASIAPAPHDDLAEILSTTPLAVTVEAHSVIGGLGSLVCEVAAERGLECRVVRCGITSRAGAANGSESYLNHVNGISGRAVADRVRAERLGR